MHLMYEIWSKRQGWLSQKIILIHDNARPHRVELIQTLLKDFHWEQFEHYLYLLYLVPSECYLFPQLIKELGGQCF